MRHTSNRGDAVPLAEPPPHRRIGRIGPRLRIAYLLHQKISPFAVTTRGKRLKMGFGKWVT
jgi:hypothetical protein